MLAVQRLADGHMLECTLPTRMRPRRGVTLSPRDNLQTRGTAVTAMRSLRSRRYFVSLEMVLNSTC